MDIFLFLFVKEYLFGMNQDVRIRLNGISKAFDGETVLDNISLAP